MTRRAASLAVALLLAAPAGARAETTTIAMPGKFFDPPRATMVAGDTVHFRNNDLVTHDVLIGPFGSGPMRASRRGRSRSTSPAATRSSARCTRSCAATSTS